MEPVVVDTVTADTLEPGDAIRLDGEFYIVQSVEDETTVIVVHLVDEPEPGEFSPDTEFDLYMYPAVEI